MTEFRPLEDKQLTELFFEAGTRKIVIMEGSEDRDVMKEWFQDRQDRIYFFSFENGGHIKVEETVQEYQSTGRVFGIIDRDFRTDNKTGKKLDGYLYILRWFCLENYLLIPDILKQDVKVAGGNVDDVTDKRILELCNNLLPWISANKICWEHTISTGEPCEYVSCSYHEQELPTCIAQKLSIKVGQAKIELDKIKLEIQLSLSTLEEAYKVISGKFILSRINAFFSLKYAQKSDYWRRNLAQTCRSNPDLVDNEIPKLLNEIQEGVEHGKKSFDCSG